MRRLFVILLFSAWGCSPSDQQGAVERFQMRATVQDVIALPQFTGTVAQVDFDPLFALTLRIESVTPPLTGFTNGSIAAFAIHSPARLFMGDTPKGKTLDFVLLRETRAGKKGFSGLEVQRKGHQQGGPAKGSQPFRSDPNRAPSAAGSPR